MVDYNIVKYCRICKARFVIPRGESKLNYCSTCQKKINKTNEVKK